MNLLPMGYLYRLVAKRPEWLRAEQVEDIYSLHDCFTKDFADYIKFWKHNGFWLFDSPEIIETLAREHSISLDGMQLFYFEVFEKEFDEDSNSWVTFSPEASFVTNVQKPPYCSFEGFDIASFSYGNTAESSPLSCVRLAEKVPTNEHCLLDTLDDAQNTIEQNLEELHEPGPYRIIAVYTVPVAAANHKLKVVGTVDARILPSRLTKGTRSATAVVEMNKAQRGAWIVDGQDQPFPCRDGNAVLLNQIK